VARVLIVGCGCRGDALAHALIADGLAVRGTTRDPGRLAAIAVTGAEAQLADPDRIGTLMSALAGVTVVCWLMGTAAGDPQQARALHDERLRMLFERLVDTPVRGVVYEAAGTLDAGCYARGREIAEGAAVTWALPVKVLATNPAEHAAWLADARAAVARLLTPSAG
jgi:nucleoside-diphosphate-sugar epimerase